MSLGPQFCSVTLDIDRAKFQSDPNAGFRRMTLVYNFHPIEDQRTEEEKYCILQNRYDPGRGGSKHLDVHHDYIQNKFEAWKAPKRIEDNM